MSRMALRLDSVSLKLLHQVVARASRSLRESRIVAMTSSMWSSAILRPSRMWARRAGPLQLELGAAA